MRSITLFARLIPVVGAAIVVLTIPARTAPLGPTLTPPSGVVAGVVSVTAAEDWATRTFNDPLDMTQRTDISWWSFSDDQPFTFMGLPTFTPCTTIGTTLDTATRCMKETTQSESNPNFYLLETGGPAEPVLGRTGDSYLIDTSVYRRLTMRMRLGGAAQAHLLPAASITQSTMNFIWYERTIYNSPAVTSNTVWTLGDWMIYVVDLPTLSTDGGAWGSTPVRTFRINPIRINNVPVEVDWIRLTPSTVQESTFSWSGASGGVDIYLDNDTDITNGNQGALQIANVPSTKTFNGAGLTHPTLSSAAGSFTIPVGSLAPGEYYVQVCFAGTQNCTASSWRYRVNAPPTLSFSNPHPEGSTNDFATVQLNNAWDMTSMSDIDLQQFITGLGVTTVNATAEDGTALGNVTVVRGSSLASGNTADPYFYPLWFAGDGRGRFKKIDSDKYHIATVEMGIPNKKRDLLNGSIARLVWFVDGDPAGENVSTDIIVNHTAGENTMAKFITSMKTLPLARPTPSDPNPSPSRVGWVGNIAAFRLDPHEFTPATEFYVKQIKLAANEVVVNNNYTVRWSYVDTDGPGTPTMTVSYDTDRIPGSGLTTICTVNPATVSECNWNAIGVPFGTYYIYASYSDGVNTNSRYGDWPVIVNGDAVDPALKPRIVLDRSRVDFGGRFNYPQAATITPAQTVRVSIAGAGGSGVAWQAVSSHPDVIVSPSTGTGDGDITISMAVKSGNEAYPPNLVGDYTVVVSELTGNTTSNSPQSVRVVFTMKDTTATAAPFGIFDTPTDNQLTSGSLAVTGWALDDVAIDRVEIWRDLITNDPVPPFIQAGHPASGKVFIANGTSVNGSRPDVEAAYPGIPNNYRAGWGYLLLTWGFPNANGTFVLTVIAWDVEGKHTILGTKTITVDNARATKPFGSIDVPAYGSTFSGHQFTFGWALTPNIGCTMAGGQVFMTMDSAPPLFPVTYGANRSDIASAFAGFADSNNAGGAVALDSRNYANGTHIIGWLVYDSCGNGEGIGSRFFTIQNSLGADTGSPPPAPALATAYTTFSRLGLPAPRARTGTAPVRLARGFTSTPSSTLTADRQGRRVVTVQPYDRIELHMDPGVVGTGYEAYLMRDGELHNLPLGSSFDPAKGIFYWQPLPGFRGNFDLVFQRTRGSAAQTAPVHVTVTVGKAGL